MSSAPTDRSALLGTWATFALGTGLVAAGASAKCRASREAWDAAVETTRTWQAELSSRDATRPVLWGPSRGSDAAAVYRDAADRLLTLDISEREAGAAAKAATPEERSVRDARLKNAMEAMLALRAGAHSAKGPGPIDYDSGFDAVVARPKPLRTLARLAVAASRRDRDAGRATSGAQWLLDGLQLGADLMNGEPYVSEITGCEILGVGLSSLAEEAPWSSWEREALQLVSFGLASLDATVEATPRSLRTEAVLFVRSLEGAKIKTLEPAWLRKYAKGLRYDGRRLGQWIAFVEDLHAQSERGWKRPIEAIDVLERTAEQHPSPYVQAYARAFATTYRSRLAVQGRLRLLRVAIGEVLGQDVTNVLDPYGETGEGFVREEVDGMLEIRSSVETSLTLRIPRTP